MAYRMPKRCGRRSCRRPIASATARACGRWICRSAPCARDNDMSHAQGLFDAYGESHRHPTNKAIHWICVPLITWSLLGVLWAISAYVAYGFVAAALLFYLWLSPPIALGMLVVSAAMVAPLALWQPGPREALIASAIVFVAAWIGQFVGHKIEGRKPSFFDDLKFLLVGPAWLLGFAYRRLNIPFWVLR